MSSSEKAFDKKLHDELVAATKTNTTKKETKMKEQITVNKFKYQSMKYALVALSLASIIAISYTYGYNLRGDSIKTLPTGQQSKIKQ